MKIKGNVPGRGFLPWSRISSGVYLRIYDDKTVVSTRPKQPRLRDIASVFNKIQMKASAGMVKFAVEEEVQAAHAWQIGSNDTWKDILTRAQFGTAYKIVLTDGTEYHPANHGYEPPPKPEPTDLPWTVVKEWSFAVDGATNAIDYVLGTGITELIVIGEAVTRSSSAFNQLVVSEDGGTTFKTTLGNYKTWATNGVPSDQTGFPIPETTTFGALNTVAWFIGLNLGNHRTVMHMTTGFVGGAMYVASDNVVNAVRLRPTAGNFNGGKWTILGR